MAAIPDKRSLILCFLVLLLAADTVRGADTPSATDERSNTAVKEDSYGDQLDEAKDAKEKVSNRRYDSEQPIDLKFGGKIISSYRYYKDIDNQKALPDFLRWSYSNDLYYWMLLRKNKTHTVYTVLTDSYVTRGVGETYTGIGADNAGVSLSMGYYQLNLSQEYGVPLRITFGRQYLFLGTGIAYAALNDGLQVEYFKEPFYVKYFSAVTRPRQDNIDYSVPGYDKNGDRVFHGLEAAYTGIPNTSLYAFGLIQKDFSSENPDLAGQGFRYNSRYLGAGLSSTFFDSLQVWSEAILEKGSTFTDSTRTPLQNESTIEASSVAGGLRYRPEWRFHPLFESSYAFASGDGNRTSPTNTLGGDTDGLDKNFLYFGYYQTGYALSPRLSNIQIAEIGSSFKPLESYAFFKKMTLGTRYYFYWKDEAEGGISDLEATGNDLNIGEEWNTYLNWQIFADISLILKYGIFFPGEAFSADTRENTQYFSSALSITF